MQCDIFWFISVCVIFRPNNRFGQALASFAKQYLPKAIVIVSAHWVYNNSTNDILVNIMPSPGVIYDFNGFPQQLYKMTYDAKTDVELAKRCVDMLKTSGLHAQTSSRAFDHGVWCPLKLMYPSADIPLVQLSVPYNNSIDIMYRAGQALAPLRDEGVMLLGSGGVVHNLGMLYEYEEKERDAAVDWASSFDEYIASSLVSRDVESIKDYNKRGPGAAYAVPTSEHFDPIFFNLGAAHGYESVTDIYKGFLFGSLSLRCFSLK